VFASDCCAAHFLSGSLSGFRSEDLMRKIFLAAAFVTIIAASAAAAQSSGSGYRLDAGDTIRVRVFDWRQALGEVHEWSGLKDTYRIGPDGNLSLPLIGTTPAAGQTAEAIAEMIADRLQTTLGLATRPQASIEVLEFRPFYILGGVNRPGGYPYRPGLTVLQAVSIAGGLSRVSDLSFLEFQRQALTTAGDLRVLRRQYDRLAAGRARLQAQLNESDNIAFPAELLRLQGDPAISRLLQEEQVTFNSRRDALRSQIDAQNHLKQLLNDEISSLGSKLQTMDQELTLLKKEKTRIASLVTQGLAVTPREFEMRQTEFHAESRRLDIGTAILRARQDVERADQAIAERRDKNRSELLSELAQAEAKLAETVERIKAASAIANRDAIAEPELGAIVGEGAGAPVYSIRRRDGAGVQTVAATDTTDVEPGDTIEVKLGKPTGAMEIGRRDESASVAGSAGDPPPAPSRVAEDGPAAVIPAETPQPVAKLPGTSGAGAGRGGTRREATRAGNPAMSR
jgi:polysaccharide biosynthesis/export protein ExoF